MYRVLIACDKFKGSASAEDVSGALARGILAVAPTAEVRTVPVADGGDGTIEAAFAAGYTERQCSVSDAYGEQRVARFAFHEADHTAVIEVAEACGLARIDSAMLRSGELDATRASSFGVGEMILAALDLGARTVILGLGGSASSDAGLGMIRALGACAVDAHGDLVDPGGAGAGETRRIDLAGVDARLMTTQILLACDVTNPLSGPSGAAVVYGPQKGVPPERIEDLDRGLRSFAALLEAELGVESGLFTTAAGAGAAGGIGFAALAVLGGTMRPGIELVLDLVGFDEALRGVDLVVTGEGRLDEQTLSGKAPAGVLARADQVPTIVVCGTSALSTQRAREAGFREVLQLVDIEPDTARCIADPEPVLEALGRQIGERLPGLAATSFG